MSDFLKGRSLQEIEQLRKAASREAAIKDSRKRLLPFISYMMPDPNADDDASKSLYEVTPQAKLLAAVVMRVEAFVTGGTPPSDPDMDEYLASLGWPKDKPLRRVCVSIGPQFGKTLLLSKMFPAWLAGRSPHKNMVIGQYNQDLAEETGDEIRAIMRNPRYKEVFPSHELRTGAESKSLLVSTKGGRIAMFGVGGSGTGKPADLAIIDDPIKSSAQAESLVELDKIYAWFQRVMYSRLLNKSGVIIVHTRWSENDLIGRLCDPSHPDHDPSISKHWLYINLEAVIGDPALAKFLKLDLKPATDPDVIEQFGSHPIAALSPGRKDLPFLAEARRLDPRGYDSLYSGKPSPDDGTYFTSDMLVEYEAGELPTNLRVYGASDHAVGTKQSNDDNVIGCFGVDENGLVWLFPDIFVGKREADGIVEEMVEQMRLHQPLLWTGELEHISRSFGPFLKKRMLEEEVYSVLSMVPSTVDLKSRCRSFQGMCALGRVRFPKNARWWPRMKQQLLRFPFATHDDFVSFCSLIGRALMKEIPAQRAGKVEQHRIGSLAWMKAQSKATQQKEVAKHNAWTA